MSLTHRPQLGLHDPTVGVMMASISGLHTVAGLILVRSDSQAGGHLFHFTVDKTEAQGGETAPQ